MKGGYFRQTGETCRIVGSSFCNSFEYLIGWGDGMSLAVIILLVAGRWQTVILKETLTIKNTTRPCIRHPSLRLIRTSVSYSKIMTEYPRGLQK